MKYTVTFHKSGNIQFNVGTFSSPVAMAKRIVEMDDIGYDVVLISQTQGA